MHELGIVQDLIAHAVEAAGGRPLKRIHAALGELSDVSPQALNFYFEELRTRSPAADAALAIRIEPGGARCLACECEFAVAGQEACPACGSIRWQVTAGDRLVLEAVEVE